MPWLLVLMAIVALATTANSQRLGRSLPQTSDIPTSFDNNPALNEDHLPQLFNNYFYQTVRKNYEDSSNNTGESDLSVQVPLSPSTIFQFYRPLITIKNPRVVLQDFKNQKSSLEKTANLYHKSLKTASRTLNPVKDSFYSDYSNTPAVPASFALGEETTPRPRTSPTQPRMPEVIKPAEPTITKEESTKMFPIIPNAFESTNQNSLTSSPNVTSIRSPGTGNHNKSNIYDYDDSTEEEEILIADDDYDEE